VWLRRTRGLSATVPLEFEADSTDPTAGIESYRGGPHVKEAAVADDETARNSPYNDASTLQSAVATVGSSAARVREHLSK
jgi:hypothetical protein